MLDRHGSGRHVIHLIGRVRDPVKRLGARLSGARGDGAPREHGQRLLLVVVLAGQAHTVRPRLVAGDLERELGVIGSVDSARDAHLLLVLANAQTMPGLADLRRDQLGARRGLALDNVDAVDALHRREAHGLPEPHGHDDVGRPSLVRLREDSRLGHALRVAHLLRERRLRSHHDLCRHAIPP